MIKINYRIKILGSISATKMTELISMKNQTKTETFLDNKVISMSKCCASTIYQT